MSSQRQGTLERFNSSGNAKAKADEKDCRQSQIECEQQRKREFQLKWLGERAMNDSLKSNTISD